MNDSPVWTGFKGDVPLKRAVSDLEADLVDHHARGYLDLLARLEVVMGESSVEDCARFSVKDCGLKRGSMMGCKNGHLSWLPHGCGSKWCMRCSAREADRRTSRLHHDILQVLTGARLLGSRWRRAHDHTRPPAVVGRAVFTVAPSHLEGLNDFDDQGSPVVADATPILDSLLKTAGDTLVDVLGAGRREVAAFLTPHPTSSKRPWMMHPHVEAVWVHARFDSEAREVEPLPWGSAKGPVDHEALGDAWRERWAGSIDPNLSYLTYDKEGEAWINGRNGQSLRSLLRYQVRPMTEDVWFALYHKRGWVLKAPLYDLSAPIVNGFADNEGTILKGFEIERSLSRTGGVCFAPRYHRVRRIGLLSNRYFSENLAWMSEECGLDLVPVSRMPRRVCECRECGEALRLLINPDTGYPYIYHHRFDIDVINRGGILAEGSTYSAKEAPPPWVKPWLEAVA